MYITWFNWMYIYIYIRYSLTCIIMYLLMLDIHKFHGTGTICTQNGLTPSPTLNVSRSQGTATDPGARQSGRRFRGWRRWAFDLAGNYLGLANYRLNHNFQRDNSLFLWPCSIAMLVMTRGCHLYVIYKGSHLNIVHPKVHPDESNTRGPHPNGRNEKGRRLHKSVEVSTVN